MEYGYCLGLYEKAMPNALTLKEKLELARHHRYDFLEISIDESDEKLSRLDWNRTQCEEMALACIRSGVPIATMCLSGHRRYPLGSKDPIISRKSIEIMEKAILLAVKLGVRLIQIAGYDEYYQPSDAQTKRNFEENLKLAVEIASRHKVMLGFETMETSFMNTCAKAMRYVNDIASPYLTIYPDIGNMTNAAISQEGDVLADLQSAQGHISALHLKETQPGIFREVPYGTGHVDFERAIAKALSLGVRSFTAEFWHTGNAGWEEKLKENNRFFRKIFGQSGFRR